MIEYRIMNPRQDSKLTPVCVNGKLFEPIYTVEEWGLVEWFIGHDYRAYGFTHSINEQVDFKIAKPFTADVLFPDGTVKNKLLQVIARKELSYIPVLTWGVTEEVYGAIATIDARELFVDKETIEFKE